MDTLGAHHWSLHIFWHPCWTRSPKLGSNIRCTAQQCQYWWISAPLHSLTTHFVMEPRLQADLCAERTFSWPTFNLAPTVSPILFSRAVIQLTASQPLVDTPLGKQLPYKTTTTIIKSNLLLNSETSTSKRNISCKLLAQIKCLVCLPCLVWETLQKAAVIVQFSKNYFNT